MVANCFLIWKRLTQIIIILLFTGKSQACSQGVAGGGNATPGKRGSSFATLRTLSQNLLNELLCHFHKPVISIQLKLILAEGILFLGVS